VDTVMQSPVRQVIPFSGGTEVTLPSGPHYYSSKRWVGSINGGVTPEQAFESLTRHATPYQSVTSVDGGIVDIPGVGRVRQHVDPDRMTIVNTTEPGHLLHPGNVFRSIVREGNDLYVVTEGYGTGIFPEVNKAVLSKGWLDPDGKMRVELNNQIRGYPMDEMNAVAGTGATRLASDSQPAATQPVATQPADRPELRIPPPIFFPPY
jgi:hypothetical protein